MLIVINKTCSGVLLRQLFEQHSVRASLSGPFGDNSFELRVDDNPGNVSLETIQTVIDAHDATALTTRETSLSALDAPPAAAIAALEACDNTTDAQIDGMSTAQLKDFCKHLRNIGRITRHVIRVVRRLEAGA